MVTGCLVRIISDLVTMAITVPNAIFSPVAGAGDAPLPSTDCLSLSLLQLITFLKTDS